MKDISPERWARINEIFDGAMDLDPVSHAEYLDRECGSDAELRSVVQDLIASDSIADEKLGASAVEMASPLAAAGAIDHAADDAPLKPGDRVGAWAIVREIGRGGMGAVYLAKRADGAFEQQVALKLVKRGMDTDEIVRRFRHERQILASLEHPNIARLIDGGAGADGRPFLAMEFVDGEPVDIHCDRVEMDIEQRLRLFMRVAEAVSHAHRNLVVHRDLKPSNILIAADGNPKLLDFGVAKLLDDSLSAESPRTEAGFRMLTPGYAAPEQLRGEPVTTAMDVYSLGVVLYELLTGRKLFSSRANATDVASMREHPTRPSIAVASDDGISGIASARSTKPDRLSRRLRGDLDTILLKALAFDPARRYPSVQEFAADVDRHLRGQPVIARPESMWYTGSKFMRRNSIPVAAASLLVVMLGAFAVAMRVEQRETAVERDRVRVERDKAEQLVGFMSGMLTAADPAHARGDTLNVFEVLERSESRVDSALSGQPEVRARMLNVMGGIYRGLGDYDRSEALLTRALTLRKDILGDRHPDVAESLHDLASVLTIKADRKRAIPLFEEALAIRRAALGANDSLVATTLHGLGNAHYWNGDHDKALASLSLADSIHRRAGSDSLLIASNLSDLAETFRALHRFEDAEPIMRETLAIRRARLGNDHPLTAASMSVLATFLRDRNNLPGAEALYREALDVRRRVLGETHPDYAKSVVGLAYTLDRQKKFEDAEALFRQALAINLSAHGPEHPEVGFDLNALAKVLFSRGKVAESEATYRRSLAVLEQSLGNDHPRVSMPQVGLGNLLMASGRSAEGLQLLRRAAALRLKEFGPKHPLTGESQMSLATGLMQLRRFEEAGPLLASAHAAYSGARSPDSVKVDSVSKLIGVNRAAMEGNTPAIASSSTTARQSTAR